MGSDPRVLLVDADVDGLAALARELRERGLRVSLANSVPMAVERAKVGAFDVVLSARTLAEPLDGSLGVFDALSLELVEAPRALVLIDDPADASEQRVLRSDPAKLVELLRGHARPDRRAAAASLAPSAHALESVSVADLLVVLATERRSGTLTVTTSKGSGELRLVDGDLVDAVYVRLEGKKALSRLVGETEGTATFTPGAPAIMRRIHEGTRELVDEARAQFQLAAALRSDLAEVTPDTLVAEGELPAEQADGLDGVLLSRLRVPATVDDVLDELGETDAALLAAILRLHAQGLIRSLGKGEGSSRICEPASQHLLRAAAAHARRAGFRGHARVVFAATPSRIAVFSHTVLTLADAVPSSEPMPTLPVPFSIANIRLGDGVEVEIVALPLVPAYAPLWSFVLSGAAMLVRLDDAARETLADACTSTAVPILEARVVFGALDETRSDQMAGLIKAALEADQPGAAG